MMKLYDDKFIIIICMQIYLGNGMIEHFFWIHLIILETIERI